MRDRSARLLRAAQKLAQARRVVQGEQKIDWDALAVGDWAGYVASLPPEVRLRVRPESLTETGPRDPATIVCPATLKLQQLREALPPLPINALPPSGFVSVPNPVGDQT